MIFLICSKNIFHEGLDLGTKQISLPMTREEVAHQLGLVVPLVQSKPPTSSKVTTPPTHISPPSPPLIKPLEDPEVSKQTPSEATISPIQEEKDSK